MHLAPLAALVLSVVSIADGDTLTVADRGSHTVVRLAEVDAPERHQPYSQVARRQLAALCQSAVTVRVVPVRSDRFDRTVAHVWCDEVHVNWRLVEDGLAWCFRRFLVSPAECLPLEERARAERRGLWREANPVAPWDFRASSPGK